jgi:glycosyltransferase involved in cell wall biosynthesis
MRTVLATPFTPTVDSGRGRRTYGIISALARHGQVDVVYGAFGANEPDAAYETLAGVSLHCVQRPSSLERVPAYLQARLRGVPGDFARGIWPRVASRAVELAQGSQVDRVIAEGPVVAAALLPYASHHPAIYSAHNLESSFRHRLNDTDMSLRALRRFERLLLNRYAECWMVSPIDMEGAAALAPAARLRFVPNVVDVTAIDPVPLRRGERRVAFVADLTYEPNRGALSFLLGAVMPNLWQQAPDVRLLIAGKGSAHIEASDPRVEARGFVPDLRDLYTVAGCAAVPLLEGGGSPLKFIEALAYGVPVVATPHAAAGLAVSAGTDYLSATPEGGAFAKALLEAIEPDRGNALARAGRKLAEREYSIEALERRLAR